MNTRQLSITMAILAIAACGESKSTDPTTGPPVAIAAQSATTQSGAPGAAAAARPSVLITDADGHGVPGVDVTFAVTTGGGSVAGANAETNSSGIATVGGWTFGELGTNTMTATVDGLSGSPVTFTANVVQPPSEFTIALQYVSTPTEAQRNAFTLAKARWEQIIVGDLSNVNLGTNADPCDGGDLVSGTVDDVLILITLGPIDGPGQILGAAGPCLIRSSNGLTIVGKMTFDTADLANLESSGSLNDVILHEMAHVFGYGSLWNFGPFNLLTGGCVDGGSGVASPGTGTNPRYTGAQARAAYTGANGGTGTSVPVENYAGSANNCPNGTRDSHWEESIFQSELMTGFISGTQRPLSLTTIRSLEDLGYVVDTLQADAFSVTTQPTVRAGDKVPALIDLGNDLRRGPIQVFNDSREAR